MKKIFYVLSLLVAIFMTVNTGVSASEKELTSGDVVYVDRTRLENTRTGEMYQFETHEELLVVLYDIYGNKDRTDGDISKNARKTNYRILSDWYYGYTVTPGLHTVIGSVSRTYHVYLRNVSYDMEYDVYNKYTGNFLRHARYHVNATEEDWRLQY